MKWPEWPLTSICRKSGFKMPVNFWLKRMLQLRWFPKWLGTTMSILFTQYSKKSLVAHPESFKKYIVGDHERNKKVSSEQLRKKRILKKAFYGSINNYRRRFCYVERNSTQSEYENVLTRGDDSLKWSVFCCSTNGGRQYSISKMHRLLEIPKVATIGFIA